MTQFLSSAIHDPTLTVQKEKIEYLKASSANTPFIREIEFRARIDEFRRNQQRYGIRISPVGWKEMRNGKRVHEATLDYNDTNKELLLNTALKFRYMTLIDFMRCRSLLELNRTLMVVSEDRVGVMQKSVDNFNFDATKLIEAEDEIIKTQLDIIDLENSVNDFADEMMIAMGSDPPIAIDLTSLVDIDFIRQAVHSFTHPRELENIHIQRARLSADLALGRYELEQSENRRYLSFVEFDYDLSRQDTFSEAFYINFGFNLPIVNPNRLDMHRMKLRSIKERNDYEILRRKTNEKISLLLKDLKRALGQYDILLGKKAAGNAESSLQVFQRIAGTNPLILLKMKESLLKTQIAIAKMNHRIFRKYINLLDVSGKLSAKPFKNYLSTTMEPLDL